MTGAGPPHAICDDFLPAAVAEAMLAQMLAGEARFTPAEVRREEIGAVAAGFRSALRLPGRVGVDLGPVEQAVRGRFDALCAAVGMKPFPLHRVERSIVAHGDGDFFKPHVDTRLGATPDDVPDVRMVSCVYYLHRLPAGFDGGELAVYGPSGQAGRIAPRHNRLVAFPSFLRHEVLPVASPSGAFADRRFSVNLWLRRPRAAFAAGTAAAQGQAGGGR